VNFVDVAWAAASGATVTATNSIDSGNNSAGWVLSLGSCGRPAMMNFTGINMERLKIN
jgi:hypothetical protein